MAERIGNVRKAVNVRYIYDVENEKQAKLIGKYNVDTKQFEKNKVEHEEGLIALSPSGKKNQYVNEQEVKAHSIKDVGVWFEYRNQGEQFFSDKKN